MPMAAISAGGRCFLDVAADFAGQAGPLYALINNASVLVYEPIEQVTEETLDRMLSAGLKAVFWGTQAFIAYGQGGGRPDHQLFVAGGLPRAGPNTAAYAAIKGRHRHLHQGDGRRARAARHPRQRDRAGIGADARHRRLRHARAI